MTSRYSAVAGKAPAGAEAAEGNSGGWLAGEHAEMVKATTLREEQLRRGPAPPCACLSLEAFLPQGDLTLAQ